MTKEIHPVGPLHGVFTVPGSKSITNRALVCAALAEGESQIRNPSDSTDTALMANGLNQLGVLVRTTAEGLVVYGTGGVLTAPKFPIPVGNAGTTVRFLLGLSALARGRVVIQGSERMAERPNDDLVEALRSLGVAVAHDDHTARFEVDGGRLQGGVVRVHSNKSSQFLSSILLVAPYAESSLTIEVDGILASPSYIEITLDVMRSFGVSVRRHGDSSFQVMAGQRYGKSTYAVEPDASGATYGFAAAAIAGGEVVVNGVRPASIQGDIGFPEVLREMGCTVDDVGSGLKVVRGVDLRGVDVDMNAMPDAVPALTVVALFAEGKTRIRNIGHLRHKESDRLHTFARELSRTGAAVSVAGDGLEVTPVPLKGALLDPHGDHRLAMSFALLGLRIPGIAVRDSDCVSKSFPRFWDEMDRLTGSGVKESSRKA